MPLRFCLAACVIACAITSPLAMGKIELSGEGRSAYVIVIADDAIAGEKHAATELRDHLEQVTGAKLPIVTESDFAGGDAPTILIGQGGQVKKLLPDVEWEALEQDGIVIKTIGDRLILAGGRPRGTLYAVSTFLQDVVGVRWWTSQESTLPHKPTLTIEDLDVTYVPKLRYREVYYNDAINDAAFAARMKLNGHHHRVPEEMGGHYTLLGWCHTSFDLVPPGQHFSKHPEWYAQLNGRRQADTQLCLSNPQMRDELTRSALRKVRKNPSAGMISISQQDTFGPCQCDDCQAIVKEEGSEAGPWIRLVNHVAEAINKEYPGFLVETLAYQYTRKPPKRVRPSRNVIVRLCSIECDFTKPLAGPSNSSFGDDLRGWSAIAPNLFIWNYVTNFASYLIPHPNLKPIAEDLRFFQDNHVIGVFQQGDSFNHLVGDFTPLRTWLHARLLWDPSLDQAKLTEEFLRGYYGAGAAEYLAQYLEMINSVSANENFRMGCYNVSTDFLSDEAIARARELFDAAGRAVAGDADLERRVRRERVAVDHLRLLRYDFAGLLRAHPDDPGAARSAYAKEVADWAAAARENGARSYSEGQGFNTYVPVLASRAARFIPPKLPPAGQPMPQGWTQIQEDRFALHRPGELSDLVEDAKASNGRAARMGGNHVDWAVQFHLGSESALTGKGPWNCYLLIRVDPKAKSGAAFSYGLHDTVRGYLAREHVGLDFAGDGEYHAYAITVDELPATAYFWVSPPGSTNWVDAVYVDRILVQKQPAQEK